MKDSLKSSMKGGSTCLQVMASHQSHLSSVKRAMGPRLRGSFSRNGSAPISGHSLKRRQISGNAFIRPHSTRTLKAETGKVITPNSDAELPG